MISNKLIAENKIVKVCEMGLLPKHQVIANEWVWGCLKEGQSEEVVLELARGQFLEDLSNQICQRFAGNRYMFAKYLGAFIDRHLMTNTYYSRLVGEWGQQCIDNDVLDEIERQVMSAAPAEIAFLWMSLGSEYMCTTSRVFATKKGFTLPARQGFSTTEIVRQGYLAWEAFEKVYPDGEQCATLATKHLMQFGIKDHKSTSVLSKMLNRRLMRDIQRVKDRCEGAGAVSRFWFETKAPNSSSLIFKFEERVYMRNEYKRTHKKRP